MPDAPSTPEEKFRLRREICMKQGKGWNEIVEIKAINEEYTEKNFAIQNDFNGTPRPIFNLLPVPATGEIVAEHPMRARQTREADNRAKRDAQINANAALAESERQKATIDDQQRQLDEMKRQIAVLTGSTIAPPAAEAALPTLEAPAAIAGMPNNEWTYLQLRQYAVENNIPLPKKGVGMKKIEILDQVLTELQKRQVAA